MEEDDSKYWFVWVTAEAGSSEALIIAELVKAGYDIDPIAKDMTMYYPGAPASLIAMRVLTFEKDVTTVFYAVEKALQKSKTKYYSLIVSETASCMFIGSNIVTEKVVSKKVSTKTN